MLQLVEFKEKTFIRQFPEHKRNNDNSFDCKVRFNSVSSEDSNAKSKDDHCITQLQADFKLSNDEYDTYQVILGENHQLYGACFEYDHGLEFFFAKIKQDDKDDSEESQSKKISKQEERIFESPFLIYSLNDPGNHKLSLINFMKLSPQTSINLGDWRFIKFVGSSRESA